ncbi:MAG: hypothetical protein P8X65_12790 [Syntrophobacterales bacterium]
MIDKHLLSFWHWFFINADGTPGYRRILNKTILIDIIIGSIIAFLVKIELHTCAKTVLIPLAGIFIGLAFAWVQNAQALLQSESIIKLAKHREGGIREYVFTYQLAILSILVSLIIWGLAGLQIFDTLWPTKCNVISYFIVKWFIFLMSSLALRECWQVVLSVQWLLILDNVIMEHKREKEDTGKN